MRNSFSQVALKAVLFIPLFLFWSMVFSKLILEWSRNCKETQSRRYRISSLGSRTQLSKGDRKFECFSNGMCQRVVYGTRTSAGYTEKFCGSSKVSWVEEKLQYSQSQTYTTQKHFTWLSENRVVEGMSQVIVS